VRPDALPDGHGETPWWLEPALRWLGVVTGSGMLALVLAVPVLLALVVIMYVALWAL
jgi:hypothetical protein